MGSSRVRTLLAAEERSVLFQHHPRARTYKDQHKEITHKILWQIWQQVRPCVDQLHSNLTLIDVHLAHSIFRSDSRNSSVGRASDWRSEGPWFNPGFRHAHLWCHILPMTLRHTSKRCIDGESNPGLPRGRREFYHWTINATRNSYKDVERWNKNKTGRGLEPALSVFSIQR